MGPEGSLPERDRYLAVSPSLSALLSETSADNEEFFDDLDDAMKPSYDRFILENPQIDDIALFASIMTYAFSGESEEERIAVGKALLCVGREVNLETGGFIPLEVADGIVTSLERKGVFDRAYYEDDRLHELVREVVIVNMHYITFMGAYLGRRYGDPDKAVGMEPSPLDDSDNPFRRYIETLNLD